MPCLLSVILRRKPRDQLLLAPFDPLQPARNGPKEVEAELLDILLKRDDLDARIGPACARSSAHVRLRAGTRAGTHSLMKLAESV